MTSEPRSDWDALWRTCSRYGLRLRLSVRPTPGAPKRTALGRAWVAAGDRDVLGVETAAFGDDLETVARYLRGQLDAWLRYSGRTA